MAVLAYRTLLFCSTLTSSLLLPLRPCSAARAAVRLDPIIIIISLKDSSDSCHFGVSTLPVPSCIQYSINASRTYISWSYTYGSLQCDRSLLPLRDVDKLSPQSIVLGAYSMKRDERPSLPEEQ